VRGSTLGTILFATLFAATAASAQDTIKIGMITPLTGSVAYNGAANANGAKLAVQERNKKGGVLGKQVELIIEDEQCQPAKAVNAAEKLIQRDQVPVIAGAFCSTATAAIMPLAEKYSVPLLSGVSSAVDLTERNNKWFFRTAETDLIMAHAFARILVETLKLKNVAYIGLNDDWGRGGVVEFSKEVESLGGKTSLKEYFEPGTTDFYTLLTRIRAAAPDGVFVAAQTQDGSIVVRQMKELGLTTKVFGVGSWATPDFIKLTQDASEGIYAAVPYASTLDTPANKAFVSNFQAAYNNTPDKYSIAGYNALNIIMEAIERAGEANPAKIRDALEKTAYDGPNGKFEFNQKRQAYGFSALLVQIQNRIPKIISQTTVEKN
jgi:branched-chain amino acid transport system substrate-binding protein